jgi:hypothetical protein
MVSPAASKGMRLVMVPSVISPAGTISQMTRGALSFPTSSLSEAADSAPFCSRAARAASAGS